MASSKLNNGTVSTSGASGGVQQMVYNKLSEYYNYGMDTTKSAVDRTVSLATHTCALSLGLAIVTSQLGLIATTSATNIFLSSLIYTKNRGNAVLQGAMSAEKAVEQRIQEAIDMTMQLAKVPADKAVEHTNSFLDIANTVFDRILGLPPVVEPVESTIKERVAFLSGRVSDGLYSQANNNVIDPVKTKLYEIAQQMQENIILADYVKTKKQWVQDTVLKPCENMTASVIELKQKIEKEASAYYITPEEMLVRSIRRTSNLLNENVDTLRKQGTELVGEKAQHLESATNFIQQLDTNLAKADNIYQIRDEVLVEAKQKVDEITRWTTSFIVGDSTQQQQPTVIPAKKEEEVVGVGETM